MATATTSTKLRLIHTAFTLLFGVATCVCGLGWHRQSKQTQMAEERCKTLSDSLSYCQNETVKKCMESNQQLRDWYQEQQQQNKREMEAIRNNKPYWLR